MMQRGPGEGFGAAKDEALALNPTLRCINASRSMGSPYFVVVRGNSRVGEGGRLARDAWASALAALHSKQEGEG